MQTLPDSKFTFNVCGQTEPLYTAIPQGEHWLITWPTATAGDGQCQYNSNMVSNFVRGATWQIKEVIRRTVDSLPKALGYELGDKVIVTRPGQTYHCYESWAKGHDLQNWTYSVTPKE